jgi:hypothetical protein
MMLVDLISRWMIPWSWAAERASAAWRLIESRASSFSGREPITCLRVTPSTYCIAINMMFADCPTS